MADSQLFDAELPVIEAIRTGDRSAFTELVRRHSGWVRAVIYGVLGKSDSLDDVTQQVWIAVWQRIGELRDTNRWKAWLYRLARNAAIDAGRGATRRHIRPEQYLREASPPGATETPVRSVGDREKHRDVLAAIDALPALYREPFVLRHLNDWSYRQIGEVMDMPVDTVETRLVRARRLLREALKNKGL